MFGLQVNIDKANSRAYELNPLDGIGGYGWNATSEYRLKIGVFVASGQFGRKFQVEQVAPLTILEWTVFHAV